MTNLFSRLLRSGRFLEVRAKKLSNGLSLEVIGLKTLNKSPSMLRICLQGLEENIYD